LEGWHEAWIYNLNGFRWDYQGDWRILSKSKEWIVNFKNC